MMTALRKAALLIFVLACGCEYDRIPNPHVKQIQDCFVAQAVEERIVGDTYSILVTLRNRTEFTVKCKFDYERYWLIDVLGSGHVMLEYFDPSGMRWTGLQGWRDHLPAGVSAVPKDGRVEVSWSKEMSEEDFKRLEGKKMRLRISTVGDACERDIFGRYEVDAVGCIDIPLKLRMSHVRPASSDAE